MLAFALALSILQAAPNQPEHTILTEFWAEFGQKAKVAGIDQSLAETAFGWAYGQYTLAACSRFYRTEEVRRWRNWWSDQPQSRTSFGTGLTLVGNMTAEAGADDAAINPATIEQCELKMREWFDLMRANGTPHAALWARDAIPLSTPRTAPK